MLYISYRKDFWNNTIAATHDAIRDVVASKETDISEEAFNASIQGKRVLLLIHGYRNTREDVIGGYRMIEQQMLARNLIGTGQRSYSQVIGITWPGGLFRISFQLAKLRANAIGDSVFARLRKISAAAKAVDIMTHSLGARVALKALQNAAPTTTTVRHLILTAPAIDDESIQRDEKFFVATKTCEDIYVMYSRNDDVLKKAYRIPIFGGGDRALGDTGPEDKTKIGSNVHLTDCSTAITQHSCYRKRIELYSYIGKVINGQSIPAVLSTEEGFVPGETGC